MHILSWKLNSNKYWLENSNASFKSCLLGQQPNIFALNHAKNTTFPKNFVWMHVPHTIKHPREHFHLLLFLSVCFLFSLEIFLCCVISIDSPHQIYGRTNGRFLFLCVFSFQMRPFSWVILYSFFKWWWLFAIYFCWSNRFERPAVHFMPSSNQFTDSFNIDRFVSICVFVRIFLLLFFLCVFSTHNRLLWEYVLCLTLKFHPLKIYSKCYTVYVYKWPWALVFFLFATHV